GDDAFEFNDTSDDTGGANSISNPPRSSTFLVPLNTPLSLSQDILGVSGQALTIATHTNPAFPSYVGLPDYDWSAFIPVAAGTFTATINYTPNGGGDLNMRLFAMDANANLIQVSSSTQTNVTTQTVSVSGVAPGQPLLVWVYGFNNAQARYDLTFQLT